VPAVDQVEFGTDLIAASSIRLARELGAWVEIPIRVCFVEVQDRSHVVDQNDIDVQTTCDQPAGLEKVVIVLGPLLLRITLGRAGESAVLIDESELLHDEVVETVEHDHNYADSRREGQKTSLREGVRLELTVLEGSDLVLFVLVIAIKWRQIQV